MREDYELAFGGKAVGRVRLCRQGLYYRVNCRCRLPGEDMCRLEASCADRQIDLGTLIPMDGGFGLDTRISVSRLGEGEITFRICAKYDVPDERIFVPIQPDEPFAYLSRLRVSILEIRDGQKGASIPAEKAP